MDDVCFFPRKYEEKGPFPGQEQGYVLGNRGLFWAVIWFLAKKHLDPTIAPIIL